MYFQGSINWRARRHETAATFWKAVLAHRSAKNFSIEKGKEPPPTKPTSNKTSLGPMPFLVLPQIVLPSKFPSTVWMRTLKASLKVDSAVPSEIKLSLKDPAAPTMVLYFP